MDSTNRPALDYDLGNSSFPRFPLQPLVPLDRAAELAAAAKRDVLRQATELFQLLDRMFGEEQIKARAAAYKLHPYEARQAAEVYQANRVAGLLAGLLSGVGEGEPAITIDGLAWTIERAAEYLARGGGR
jgi:hypothetical protein